MLNIGGKRRRTPTQDPSTGRTFWRQYSSTCAGVSSSSTPTSPGAWMGHALGDVGDAGSSALSSRRRIRSAYAACASFVGVPGVAAPPLELTAITIGDVCALRSLRRRERASEQVDE